MTDLASRRAWQKGRVPFPLEHFYEPDDVRVATIDRVERVIAGNDPVYVLVFVDGPTVVNDEGREVRFVYDLRLTHSDIATLRRILGPSREWHGRACLLEARVEGCAGDGRGGGRRFVRVARPRTWVGCGYWHSPN